MRDGGGIASRIGPEPLPVCNDDEETAEDRWESPWMIMFADDIVVCSESREQVKENLERWRYRLERRGMKVSGVIC